MKYIIALAFFMLSACIMDEKQMSEEELMSKQKTYIDTIMVKDIHVDTTFEIRTTKINDSVTIFDTLKIVKTIQAIDTLKTTINQTTHSYDTTHTIVYDTIAKVVKMDTIRSIVNDTINHTTIVFDTIHTVVKDTVVKMDTIYSSPNEVGTIYDAPTNSYYGWVQKGALKVIQTYTFNIDTSRLDTIQNKQSISYSTTSYNSQYYENGVYKVCNNVNGCLIVSYIPTDTLFNLNDSTKFDTTSYVYFFNIKSVSVKSYCPNGYRPLSKQDAIYLNTYLSIHKDSTFWNSDVKHLNYYFRNNSKIILTSLTPINGIDTNTIQRIRVPVNLTTSTMGKIPCVQGVVPTN